MLRKLRTGRRKCRREKTKQNERYPAALQATPGREEQTRVLTRLRNAEADIRTSPEVIGMRQISTLVINALSKRSTQSIQRKELGEHAVESYLALARGAEAQTPITETQRLEGRERTAKKHECLTTRTCNRENKIQTENTHFSIL